MKHVAIALSLAILSLVVLRTPSAEAAQLFIDYFGYDYESPNPNPGTFGEAGSVYNSLGPAPNLFAPLAPDTARPARTDEDTTAANKMRARRCDIIPPAWFRRLEPPQRP